MRKLILIVALFVGGALSCVATVTSQVEKSGPFLITTSPQTISVGFPFVSGAELLVLDTGPTSSPHDPALVLTLGSDYTVTGGNYNGSNQMQPGSIVVVSSGTHSVATNDYIVIMRKVPVNQTSSFTTSGPNTVLLLEQMGDKLATLSQQVNEVTTRSLQFENFEFLSGTLSKALRSGKLLGFNSNGVPVFYDPDITAGTVVTNSLVLPNGATVARTLGALFGDILNVKDYGAVGDGSTNDTIAIATAIADLPPGTSLRFPAGTYLTDAFAITTNNVSIVGDGMGQTIIKINANQHARYVMKLNGSTSVSIRDLTLDGNRSNGGTLTTPSTDSGVLYIDASRVNVERVEARASADTGIFVGSNSNAPTSISFDHCYIHDNGGVTSDTDNGHGIVLGVGLALRPLGVQITNSSFVDNHNTITTANDSCAILSAAQNIIITGNTFKNNYNIGGGQVVLYSDVTGSGANRVDAVVSNNFFTLTSTVSATDATGGLEINGYGFTATGNVLENPQADLPGTQHAFQTDAGGVGDVTIVGNTVKDYDVGFAQLGDGTHLLFAQNLVNNSAGSIRYGAAMRAGSVDVMITGNDFTGCSNAIPGTASSTTVVSSNTLPSYPVPGSITVGASPYTYTSGETKEVISVAGGTASAVAVGGHTLFFTTGCSVTLPPHTAMIVTYTVLPQMYKTFLQ